MPRYQYVVNEAYFPGGTPLENAKQRLHILRDAIGLLNENNLGSAQRQIVAVGFYNTFYVVFELIMQAKKKSLERIAYEKWKGDRPEDVEEFDSLYRSFRNLMTHQGVLIPPSYTDWGHDDYQDTLFPSTVFPKFMSQTTELGVVVREYNMIEWAIHCMEKVARALSEIEAIVETIKLQRKNEG
ncbi:hypothetical protein [Acidiphilium iwatense]|uniref:Uncharacterized protein n=1 Tax=Acidiphilium iwatense TaxID=768198 RepID=A0ABS9DX74_9PROT|nr:hypothetical protein [Acidiphilium iwatense]MCF3947344.1 hypothetical protein [Acidiphilium iwatense]